MTELRATREQVELLLTLDHPLDISVDTVHAICRGWLDMAAVIEVAQAAGPWPRYQNVLIQTEQQAWWPFCIDCGMQCDLPHRDDCFGVRIANALAALTDGGTQADADEQFNELHSDPAYWQRVKQQIQRTREQRTDEAGDER